MLALSVIVFWLLQQFSRDVRALRLAARSPLGQVASTVMLQSRLSVGMRLPDVIKLTGSVGQKLRDEPETLGVARCRRRGGGGRTRRFRPLQPLDDGAVTGRTSA